MSKAQDTKYIYEVYDTTDDMIFYPIGVFLSLDEAKENILNADPKHKLGKDNDDDFEQITIYKRAIGFGDNGDSIFVADRSSNYHEETDSFIWSFTYCEDFLRGDYENKI